MSRQESIECDSDPNWKKIVGDKGNTPGNDRCVVLECGHTVLVSLPSNSDGGSIGSWVGCEEICTTCMGQEKVQLEFDVDPYTGIASLISKITPLNYRLLELSRKGTKAVATFIKKKE